MPGTQLQIWSCSYLISVHNNNNISYNNNNNNNNISYNNKNNKPNAAVGRGSLSLMPSEQLQIWSRHMRADLT